MTKYMVVSHHQNVGQNYSLLIDDKSCECVVQFKYLGKTVIYESCIHEQINSRLNSGNACYHCIQSPIFPSPL
jgi:hypothetical protein